MLRILAVTGGAVAPGAFYAHSWLAAPLSPAEMALVEEFAKGGGRGAAVISAAWVAA